MDILWAMIGGVFLVAVYLLGWLRGQSQKRPSATEQLDCPYKVEPQTLILQDCLVCGLHLQNHLRSRCPECGGTLSLCYRTTAAPHQIMEEQPIAQAMEPPLDMSSNSEIQDGSRRVVRLTPSGIPYLWLVEPSSALTPDT